MGYRCHALCQAQKPDICIRRDIYCDHGWGTDVMHYYVRHKNQTYAYAVTYTVITDGGQMSFISVTKTRHMPTPWHMLWSRMGYRCHALYQAQKPDICLRRHIYCDHGCYAAIQIILGTVHAPAPTISTFPWDYVYETFVCNMCVKYVMWSKRKKQPAS